MVNTSKSVIRKILKRLEKGEFGQNFKMRSSKNGRGDYGVDETYFDAKGVALFTISFDGARQDTRYMINKNIM